MSTTTYLTPEQAADRLPRFNADWVRAQLRTGKLRGSKVGGRWLVEETAIRAMLDAGSNTQQRSEASTRRRRRRAIGTTR